MGNSVSGVDLFVVMEGRRDRAVMEAVLNRPYDLGIQPITYEFDLRFSAVRTGGPDAGRERRGEFRYVICLWDHQGSGEENKPPSRVQGEVQARLNRNTLKGFSKALVIDPELEIWLWRDRTAIASILEVDENRLTEWLNDWRQAQFPKQTVETLLQQFPKEALEEVMRRAGEKPDAALYGRITAIANLQRWSKEPSFRRLCSTLRKWFAK